MFLSLSDYLLSLMITHSLCSIKSSIHAFSSLDSAHLHSSLMDDRSQREIEALNTGLDDEPRLQSRIHGAFQRDLLSRVCILDRTANLLKGSFIHFLCRGNKSFNLASKSLHNVQIIAADSLQLHRAAILNQDAHQIHHQRIHALCVQLLVRNAPILQHRFDIFLQRTLRQKVLKIERRQVALSRVVIFHRQTQYLTVVQPAGISRRILTVQRSINRRIHVTQRATA
mmetsp:Transcript_24813/g.39408  ORF Transcript_24813/g.39408 Transcript_24813/m.39408 type:complete len:227 (+) Transcript_24813:6-686(+)